MSRPKNMLDTIVAAYVETFRKGRYIDQAEMDQIIESLKKQVLDDAVPLFEETELEKARKDIELEVRAYRKKLLHKLTVSIIIETIFIAFIVGLIVNQVTNLIPDRFGIWVIIVGMLICVLFVSLLVSGQEK